MKKLLIIIFAIYSVQVQGQQIDFTIKGEVLNDNSFKYVSTYNNNFKLLKKVEIIDGKFTIDGKYDEKERFGEPASALLILTKVGEVEPTSYPSNFKHYHFQVILGEPVVVTYKGGNEKRFSIKGGEKNLLNQQFEDVYWRYRNKRDSAFLLVDNSNLSIIDKNEQRLEIHNNLFRMAINETISIVDKNRNSFIALSRFSPIIYSQYVSGKIVDEMFNNFSIELKESYYGINMYKDIEDKLRVEEEMSNPSYTLGMIMPEFELPDQSGKMINSNAVFKKYTLIDFWATWCLPCRNETPNILSAFENYNKKGFKVITVSVDELTEHAKWLATLKSDNMGLLTNLISDLSKSRIVRTLNINALPSNYLVDENGKIVAINLRGKELQDKLKELMP